MTRIIRIFDTTLRDGEQSPGASMNVEEKIMIAKQLARLNVDIIEAGFAYSSPGDFEAVKRIAGEVEGPTICSLATRQTGRYRSRMGSVKRRAEGPHPYLFVHIGHPFETSISDEPRRGA